MNPFFRARLPVLRELLGGRLPTLEQPTVANSAAPATAFALDATLETEGLPQSGTGQASLLTGTNAARLHGSHFGPWIPVRLRPLVEERNVLSQAVSAGRSVAFANAYPRDWPGERHRRRVAGPPLAARAAGLLTRDHADLRNGGAVASEIENDGWRRWLADDSIPQIDSAQAGAHLAAISNRHDLTFFAHYTTDTEGHRGGMDGAVRALERVDGFFGGLVNALSSDRTLLVVSDHGNIEDVRVGHTRNPALGLAVGAEAEALAGELTSLTDVAKAVLKRAGATNPGT